MHVQFIRRMVFGILTIVAWNCTSNDKQRITASGTLEATEVTISAKAGGEIVGIRVEEGADIVAGDTLVILDRADLELQLKQAEANTAAASAQYKLAVSGARSEDIIQAEATLVNAQADLQRMQDLFAAKSVTQKQLDDARMRLTIAEQTYNRLKQGSRSEEIEAARARRDQAIAQVDAVRKKISDSFIIAPSNGTVTKKSVEVGETVMPSAALLTLTQLDKIYLMIYVTEKELASVQLGQPVHIYIDAYPDKPFAGTVTYISPTAEFTPRNIQTKEERTKLVFGVKVGAANTDHILKAGMPADAVINLQGTSSSLK